MSADRPHARPRRSETSALPFVRASELGEFAYCRRAWWLRHVLGIRSDAPSRARLARGHGAHAQHARDVARGGRERLAGWLLLAVAVLLLLLAMGAG